MPRTWFRATLSGRVVAEDRTDDDGFADVQVPQQCPESLIVAYGAETIEGPFEYESKVIVDCGPEDAQQRGVRCLHNLGYESLAELESAVTDFQSDYGLSVTGLDGDRIPNSTIELIDEFFQQRACRATP